jgi:hypothetical protein
MDVCPLSGRVVLSCVGTGTGLATSSSLDRGVSPHVAKIDQKTNRLRSVVFEQKYSYIRKNFWEELRSPDHLQIFLYKVKLERAISKYL